MRIFNFRPANQAAVISSRVCILSLCTYMYMGWLVELYSRHVSLTGTDAFIHCSASQSHSVSRWGTALSGHPCQRRGWRKGPTTTINLATKRHRGSTGFDRTFSVFSWFIEWVFFYNLDFHKSARLIFHSARSIIFYWRNKRATQQQLPTPNSILMPYLSVISSLVANGPLAWADFGDKTIKSNRYYDCEKHALSNIVGNILIIVGPS